LIGFRPVWKPEDHTSIFTAAEGWGFFTQQRTPSGQREQIAVRYGRLALKSMVFSVAPGIVAPEVNVRVGEETVPSSSAVKDGAVRISLAAELVIGAGQAVDVIIR
jgi:hypothetical protein